MQAELLSVSNPRWANAEQTAIDCEITISAYPGEILPFTASPEDPEAHGRKIFADCVAGVYGEVAHFVPPVPNDSPTTSLPTSVL